MILRAPALKGLGVSSADPVRPAVEIATGQSFNYASFVANEND